MSGLLKGTIKKIGKLSPRISHSISRSYESWDLKKAKILSTEPLANPKWVESKLIKYTTPGGNESTWEYCSRMNRVKPSQVTDAVAIMAVLKLESGPRLVLQRQFRPPVGGICIEMPAGLLDKSESVEECAERELYEETGYRGIATVASPPIFNDMGFSDNNVTLVTVEIDMSKDENKTPIPMLEENEFIETFTLPLAGLRSNLDKLHAQGFHLCSRLYDVSAGLELAGLVN